MKQSCIQFSTIGKIQKKGHNDLMHSDSKKRRSPSLCFLLPVM